MKICDEMHCVKSVRNWSYSGPHFPRIWTEYREILSVFSPNAGGKYRKNADQNNSEYRNFLRSDANVKKI